MLKIILKSYLISKLEIKNNNLYLKENNKPLKITNKFTYKKIKHYLMKN